jgi:hypothetical protein
VTGGVVVEAGGIAPCIEESKSLMVSAMKKERHKLEILVLVPKSRSQTLDCLCQEHPTFGQFMNKICFRESP